MLYKLVLVILFILSLITKNKSLAFASLLIFLVSLSNNYKTINFIEKYFMDIGMIFLMIWMLVPLIKQNNTSAITISSLLSVKGIISFTAGIIVVVLASRGVNLLKGNTDTLAGVVIGSIVGVALLGGVPVGPLVASGIAYEIIKFINFIFKNGA
ncbi:MAG: DUF441 domain-containing protein [Clostridium sp.]|nr:DUF441 domain-containing protein [Clostridium sp.]